MRQLSSVLYSHRSRPGFASLSGICAGANASRCFPAAAYADEPLVIERSETVVEVAADGTGWTQRTLVARLQADAGVKRYSVLTIQYAGNSRPVEIAYARVTHADGTVVGDAADGGDGHAIGGDTRGAVLQRS